METLLLDGLFVAGVILLPIGMGMVVMGVYVRTFRAALVGAGLLLAGGIIVLTGA